MYPHCCVSNTRFPSHSFHHSKLNSIPVLPLQSVAATDIPSSKLHPLSGASTLLWDLHHTSLTGGQRARLSWRSLSVLKSHCESLFHYILGLDNSRTWMTSLGGKVYQQGFESQTRCCPHEVRLHPMVRQGHRVQKSRPRGPWVSSSEWPPADCEGLALYLLHVNITHSSLIHMLTGWWNSTVPKLDSTSSNQLLLI